MKIIITCCRQNFRILHVQFGGTLPSNNSTNARRMLIALEIGVGGMPT